MVIACYHIIILTGQNQPQRKTEKTEGRAKTQLKSYVYDIIGCCQDVHKELGPWLNESRQDAPQQ